MSEPGAARRRVGYSVQGGIASIELLEPPANCYSYEMMRELDDAILAARFDDDVHVLLLRGAAWKSASSRGLALERELQQQLFLSDDAAEGIRAYNDKRSPEFKGR